MQDLLTFAFVAFAPLYYLFQAEFAYDTATENPQKVALSLSTVLSTALYFSYLQTAHAESFVYYLLVGSVAGPFLDLSIGIYPNTGTLCHIVSLGFFLLIHNLPDYFMWLSGGLILLSVSSLFVRPKIKSLM